MSSPASTRETTAYETVVGLEVHVELKTASKVFCSCGTSFGAPPNSQVCPVCLGMPGVLPVLNEKALEQAIRAALALNCRVRSRTKFDRKNYHYPDLAKGYQISQYDLPLGYEGFIEIAEGDAARRIRIRRVHLEEDTGKSLHDQVPGASVIELNRAGVPLLEIVSEPDLRSPEQARQYLQQLRLIMAYTGVSDVRMEEGSLRVDCNVSVRPAGSDSLDGVITEIKNLNSFRSVTRAIAYEAERQWRVLSGGGRLERETRHWDERREITVPSRSKEEAHDYRYFPEPDLPPVHIDSRWVEQIRASLPELPAERRRRYVDALGLAEADADILVAEPALASYFDRVAEASGDPRTAASWVTGILVGYMKAENLSLSELKVTPAQMAELLRAIEAGTVSNRAAKDVFEEMAGTGADAAAVIEKRGLKQISDQDQLASVIDQVIQDHPDPVADYRSGKDKALGFLVGQVMRVTKGRANPQLVNELLRARLGRD